MGKTSVTREAAFETSNIDGYKLVTTPKIELIENKILLPSVPEGELLFNMMFVFDAEDVLEIYECKIVIITDKFFAEILNAETEVITGFGLVSYLQKITK